MIAYLFYRRQLRLPKGSLPAQLLATENPLLTIGGKPMTLLMAMRGTFSHGAGKSEEHDRITAALGRCLRGGFKQLAVHHQFGLIIFAIYLRSWEFACFLEQFAADRHRAVKGLLGALSDFYEETGGPGRKAFLPTKVAQARHLHKKGTKAAQVKLRHNLDLASFTLSSALEMAAQFSTNPIREHLHGTPGKWE
ncbi:unnamed protein product, partial [Durusdinium trenchii]